MSLQALPDILNQCMLMICNTAIIISGAFIISSTHADPIDTASQHPDAHMTVSAERKDNIESQNLAVGTFVSAVVGIVIATWTAAKYDNKRTLRSIEAERRIKETEQRTRKQSRRLRLARKRTRLLEERLAKVNEMLAETQRRIDADRTQDGEMPLFDARGVAKPRVDDQDSRDQ